jgi:hypothetical protein
MLDLGDIFRRYGPAYRERFGDAVLPSHRRALDDLAACRTPALGGQRYACDHCGYEHYVYHSCRNRSCPTCHATDTARWLAERRTELLPVPYFHIVFTVPQEFRDIARRHQQTVYGLMLRAAADSLLQLAANPRYVGGLIGVTALLHTWTRTLVYHPHVHCLVPGGGVSPDERWLPARPNFLVPVQALSNIFRAKLRDGLRDALPEVPLAPALFQRDWVVYAKPPIGGPEHLLEYLARYVHRIALTNARLVGADDGQVTFRYQPTGRSIWKTMTLPADEFLRRFLQHVLPAGFHKVRYYGLAHPTHRPLLRRVQLALALDPSVTPPHPSPTRSPQVLHEFMAPPPGAPPRPAPDHWPSWAGQRCPRCQLGRLVLRGRLPHAARPPP